MHSPTSPKFKGNTLLERCTSLWLLPLFFIVPLFVITQKSLGGKFVPTNAMLASNALLLLYILARLVRIILGNRLARSPQPRHHLPAGQFFPLSPEEVLEAVSHAGYTCDMDGAYGERGGKTAKWANTLLHAGLALILATGVWDNLREFTGVLFLGGGEPIPLYDKATYSVWSKGLLASYEDIGFKIRNRERFLPSPSYPHGGVEVTLHSRDGGDMWHGVVTPETPHRQGNYDFKMACFIYDIWIVITTVKDHLVYTDWVRFHPLGKPLGIFTHTGEIKDDFHKVYGSAWYDQRTDRLRIQVRYKGEPIEVELGEAPEHRKVVNGYLVQNEGIGRWTQLHVLRHRHIPLLATGGAFFVAGLLMRLLFPLKRVWLEPMEGGCMVSSRDRRLLSVLDARTASQPASPEVEI